jgi:SAM-dependent methyltransferase
MERYLDGVGLPADLDLALDELRSWRGHGLAGVGADLAAGQLWAEPRLLRSGAVERIYAVEFSRHRLLEIGPRVLDHYGVPEGSVVLAWGSFYDLGLPDDSIDFVFMSQAFHHAARPEALLREIRRVLKPGGIVVIVGEHVVHARDYGVHYAKLALTALPPRLRPRLGGRPFVPPPRKLLPRAMDLYPGDEAGDHVYTRREYGRMFGPLGFHHRRFRRAGSQYQGYLLALGSAPVSEGPGQKLKVYTQRAGRLTRVLGAALRARRKSAGSAAGASAGGPTISDAYQQQNRQMHEEREGYGVMAQAHLRELQILTRVISRDVLDYGCGKRLLEKGLGFPISNYDPGIPGLDSPPEPADVVACIDVLEHIEPDLIGNVIDDLARVTRRVGYFEISTVPATKNLPDGRNAHLIVESPDWWAEQMGRRFEVLERLEGDGHVTCVVAPKRATP